MRPVRRSLRVIAFIATLVLGTAAMAVIVVQTTWFKEWLRGFIVRQAEDYLNGQLSIGRLDGNLLFGVELEDVDVTMNGERVIHIQDVGLDYNAFTFLRGDVVLDDIRINRPVVRVERTSEGWNLARLINVRTPEEPRSGRTIVIGEIGVSDGTIDLEGVAGTPGIETPSRIERIDASLGVRSDAGELRVDIGHLSLRSANPEFGINALSGVIRRTADEIDFENVSLRTEESSIRVDGSIRLPGGGPPILDMTAASDRVSVSEIGRIVPAVRKYRVQPAFEIRARGPADRMAVDVRLREPSVGQITADLTVDGLEPGRRVAGTVSLDRVNIGPIAPRDGATTLVSTITGTARFDVALPEGQLPVSGTYRLDLGHVAIAGYEARNVAASGRIDGQTLRLNATALAYGGSIAANGTVRVGRGVAVDVIGQVANLDLRSLPPPLTLPGAPSDLQFTYAVSGQAPRFEGRVTFDQSMLTGATIARGTVARFDIGGGAPSFGIDGQVANLDLRALGRGFGIRALAQDRFQSRLNAAIQATGSGGGRYPLTLEAAGTLVDSSLFGAGVPRLEFTASLAGGDARVRAAGQFTNLDPGAIATRERIAGDVSGEFDIGATIWHYRMGVNADSLDASGRIALVRSRVAGLVIDSATVAGQYARREGRLDEMVITGPDLNATGRGTIALNDSGASTLTLRVEASALHRIGEMIGRPLKGAAVVEAAITGNARELRAEGMLDGANLGYGEIEALSVDTAFTVVVPDLTLSLASVKATTTAAFVEVGGRRIREVKADTTYAQQRIDFQAALQEGMRDLTAGGSVVLHPDHQEVHLNALALRAEQVEWRTPPGSESAIRYGSGRVEVRGLQLVSGDQRIAAEGVLGETGQILRVRLENVDVAALDRLALGEQRIGGRLDAEASLTGPIRAPQVAAQFTLSPGSFRNFTFDSLAGGVEYAAGGARLEVRLQQTPGAWITVKGFAPATLYRSAAGNGEGSAPEEERPVDLEIATSEIDLGVIQGFTSHVTDVTGIVQANVRVTGSGRNPDIDGAIDIKGGAFALPGLGTRYTGLDTRIELGSDVVTVREFKILDDRGFPMTVGGNLAIDERTVGNVNISVRSENFEVIDNDLADLKLDLDVHITGELRRPLIEGRVEIENGTVHVARVIEVATSDPYAIDSTGPAGAQDGAAGRTGLLTALAMNLTLHVPNNLVVRGNDLRPANAPIGVGDINVTLGGDIQLRKRPGEPIRITGDVHTIRGTYTFQGRRFDVVRDGRVRFTGTDVIDPILELRATRVISGVETTVHILGTLRQPELRFSSNPPLDPADILSLIVFNQPVNQLGAGQQASLAARAGALAGAYLASGVARSIGDALELDVFEIQTQGEGGAGPSITVGEQVGEKLFVRLRQGFGAGRATEFILEYQIAEFLHLQGKVAETSGDQPVMFRRIERGGIDLIFFFSY